MHTQGSHICVHSTEYLFTHRGLICSK